MFVGTYNRPRCTDLTWSKASRSHQCKSIFNVDVNLCIEYNYSRPIYCYSVGTYGPYQSYTRFYQRRANYQRRQHKKKTMCQVLRHIFSESKIIVVIARSIYMRVLSLHNVYLKMFIDSVKMFKCI